MWAKFLLLGALLSFFAGLHAAAGGDSDEGSQTDLNRPPGFCQLPPDRRKCSNESSFWFFYNSQAGVCETFVYQGCQGNGNKFASQLACLKTCANRAICRLPRDSGTGDAFRTRFFYNPVSKACESFLYRGHRGNANNFRDEDTCTQFCGPQGPRRRCPKAPKIGICISQCQSDADCGGLLCCPTGCGTACRRGVEEDR